MKTRTIHPEPVIDKVRAIRHRVFARHGHDPRRLVEYYLERQQLDAPPEAKAVQKSQGSADQNHAR